LRRPFRWKGRGDVDAYKLALWFDFWPAGSRALPPRYVMTAAKRRDQRVIYLLEFYHHPPENGVNRIQLTTEKRRLKSPDLARAYARGAMENVLFDGKAAHSCRIKDQAGTLICEVKSDADKP